MSTRERKTITPQQDSVVTNNAVEGWIWQSVKVEKPGIDNISLKKPQKTADLLSDEWYDCAFCSGTGEKPRGSVCSVCKGKKRIQIKSPVVKCASCKGRGEEKPRTNVTCTPCRGKGYVGVVEPVDVCPSCNGLGRTRGSNLACVQCKGIGVITVKY